MKRKGICFVCGCTDDAACMDDERGEPCSWANLKQTLCTHCEPLNDKDRRKRRAEALAELVKTHELVVLECRELQKRISVLQSEGAKK